VGTGFGWPDRCAACLTDWIGCQLPAYWDFQKESEGTALPGKRHHGKPARKALLSRDELMATLRELS